MTSRFARCGFCQERELEPFSDFSYCHACHGIEVRHSGAQPRRHNDPNVVKPPDTAKWFRHRELSPLSPKLLSRAERAALRSSLLDLPKNSRRISILHFWKNLSAQEIAKKTGLTLERIHFVLNAVYARLRRVQMKYPNLGRFVHSIEFEIDSNVQQKSS